MSAISIIENTFFANGRSWGCLNSSFYQTGSICAMQTGIDSADLNMAWNEKPLRPEEAGVIHEIKRNFKKKGLPFWWWVFPRAQSQTTVDLLKTAGFSLIDSIPSMMADLNLFFDEESQDPAISVVRIKTREELHLWKEVSFSGFDFTPDAKKQYNRFFDAFNLASESPQKFFLALWNGKPVATSLLFLHENTGGIYFVTTLAEHRKKGIGLKITQATVRFAKMAGAQYATLQSSSDGSRVYQQAGFQEYCLVDTYCLQASKLHNC